MQLTVNDLQETLEVPKWLMDKCGGSTGAMMDSTDESDDDQPGVDTIPTMIMPTTGCEVLSLQSSSSADDYSNNDEDQEEKEEEGAKSTTSKCECCIIQRS